MNKLESKTELSKKLREDLKTMRQNSAAAQGRYDAERDRLAEATQKLQEQQRALEELDVAAKNVATETATAKQLLKEVQAASKEKQVSVFLVLNGRAWVNL